VGALLGGGFFAADGQGATRSGKVVKVVDGDTVRVMVENRPRLVHLAGVRSRSAKVCRGRLARTSLSALLPRGRKVRVFVSRRTFPRARSFRGEIYLGNRTRFRTVNRSQMLRGGTWVRTPRSQRSRFHTAYARAELKARKGQRGIWGQLCPGAPPNAGVGRGPVAAPAPSPALWPWEPATPDPSQPSGVGLVLAAKGFERPLYVTGRPGATGLIVVEQRGLIRVARDGAPLPRPFLDLTAVVSQAGGERGLLGLAFHPDHAINGLFYVNYVDSADSTRIVEYYAPPGTDVATPESSRVILTLPQPEKNHNGGHLAFGRDRMLYAALGDGGNSKEGQNLASLFGAILRIDVAGRPYRVPVGNPFSGTPGARGEIWAFGLRNPWRFSFDRVGDAMWIGDVGESMREEINFRASGAGGANFGWRAFEGTLPSTGTLAPYPHVPPVTEYSTGPNCSVTGGYVYRGAAVPGLYGKYVYSDYCSGKFWTLDPANPALPPVEITGSLGESVQFVTSFGEDLSGELHVIGGGGKVYRFAATASAG